MARRARTMAIPAVLLALSSAGCSLDFNQFTDPNRMPPPGNDGGVTPRDVPGQDTAQPPRACARPYVMVGMTSGRSNDTGRIARFSITGTGTERCDDLRGGGALDRGGWAVADIPGAGIAYGYNEGFALIDEATDRVLWDVPYNDTNLISLEAFPLQQPGGPLLAAVVVANVRIGSINEPWGVRAYNTANGELVFDWNRSASTPNPWPSGLSSPLRSFTFNPQNPSEALTIRADSSGELGSPAIAVNFFESTLRRFAGMQGSSPIALMTTIAATSGERQQLTWTGGANLGVMDGVYYLRYPAGDGTGTPMGPQRCASLCMRYDHVVPDPTSDVNRFTICSSGGATPVERIVRMADCSEVTSSATEGDAWTFRRLGVAFGL